MDVATKRLALRHRLYLQLEPTARQSSGLSPINSVVCAAIVLSAIFAIVETEPEVVGTHAQFFLGVEWIFTVIFLVEYIARVWVSAEDARYGPGAAGKLRYVRSPTAIIDLLALAPILLTLGGSEAFLMRAFRLLRILRLARLAMFSPAMRYLGDAVRSRKYELTLSVCIAVMVLVLSSTLLYLAEGTTQPEAFGSIPRAMWWAASTLTTVGYGDVYPVTPAGKMLGAVTAVTGIGLIALPTGILAAAFSDALQRRNVGGDQ